MKNEHKFVLKAEDVKGYYRGWFGVVYAVDEVSLTIDEGEILGLAGESGCGKTTFAKLITGTPYPLLHFEDGKIDVAGYDVWKTPPETLRKEVKCKILSYIPQASLNALNPTLRIREFVADMFRERTGHKYSADEARQMLGDHFKMLNLDERVLDLYPHELSGGMKQRTVIGISTYAKPSLLITDEPTSSLDVSSQKRVIEFLINLRKQAIVKSAMIISHDLATLRQICDRIAIMYAGKLVEVGRTDDIINDPTHPYTKMLLNAMLVLDRSTKDKRKGIVGIRGRPPDLRHPPPGCRFHPRCSQSMAICESKEPPLIEVGDRSVSCWLFRKR